MIPLKEVTLKKFGQAGIQALAKYPKSIQNAKIKEGFYVEEEGPYLILKDINGNRVEKFSPTDECSIKNGLFVPSVPFWTSIDCKYHINPSFQAAIAGTLLIGIGYFLLK